MPSSVELRLYILDALAGECCRVTETRVLRAPEVSGGDEGGSGGAGGSSGAVDVSPGSDGSPEESDCRCVLRARGSSRHVGHAQHSYEPVHSKRSCNRATRLAAIIKTCLCLMLVISIFIASTHLERVASALPGPPAMHVQRFCSSPPEHSGMHFGFAQCLIIFLTMTCNMLMSAFTPDQSLDCSRV